MKFVLAFLASCTLNGVIRAEDWPQIAGPNRNNTTSEILKPWTSPLRELWRTPIGEGSSTALVVGGKVFLHAKVDDKEEEELIALDAATGKVIFRNGYVRRPYRSNTGNGPRTTPAVSLGRIYAYGVSGMLTCFSAENGRIIWQVDVYKQFGVTQLRYGVTSSPLVEGNRVLVHVGSEDTSVAAFDADTGKMIWKALADPITTSAPNLAIVGQGAKRQAVFQTALRIVGLNPLDGKLLWEYPIAETPLDSAGFPVWTGEVLLSSSVHFGGRGLKLTDRGDKTEVSEAWHNEKLGSYFGSTVPARDGCFYMVTNTPMPGASLRCVDGRTGKLKWTEPNVAEWFVGLIGTGNGNLLVIDGKGNVRLVAADSERYVELARAEINFPSSVAPVLANGKLFLRDRKQILCLDVSK
jgi:outer membrane protein assembly factor BamB